jgi:anion-transporting  ArsA/GET3 family ATPase
VNHLIVNYIIQEADCEFHRVRREMQQGYMKILEDQYAHRTRLVRVPLSPREIKGIERIRNISEILFKPL